MAAVGGVVGYGAGHLSDHFGRRRVILAGQGILAVYVLLFLTVGGNIWFGLGLMVGAAGLGSFGGSAGQAMVADLVPPDRHEEAYASVRVAANLGVTMGPPIGSLFLLVGGWTLFFPCVSLLALTAWFLAFRYLPKRGAYAPEGPPERGSLRSHPPGPHLPRLHARERLRVGRLRRVRDGAPDLARREPRCAHAGRGASCSSSTRSS